MSKTVKNTTSRNTNQSGSSISLVPEIKEDDYKRWVENLYTVSDYTDADIASMWEAFSYKGFNREDVLRQLAVKIGDKKIVTEIIIVSALRGPQAGSSIKLSNGKSAIELGVPASGGQGTKVLTMNKIQAATADLAAFFLKKMNAPKRINMDLPGWLQFPAAGSIKLPAELRQQHLEFSKRFSTLIGGTFNESIYMQMEHNAYLDSNLGLFS
jgi:hypothetical protein